MPRRDDLESILIIGSGPIVIGQACEFDYSGTQACKALREEGYRVILVNSNPATIMTDPETADETYIEPITAETIAKIIEFEKPDAVLPTLGGQTGLNTALELFDQGVFERHGVEMIGANAEVIRKAEDRDLFRTAMANAGLECARSGVARSMDDARRVMAQIGLPCVIRPAFTLGGAGGGIAFNVEEFEEIVTRGLSLSMNNAAVAVEKDMSFESASKLYERLWQKYPNSPNAANALWRTAINYQKFFEFDKAVNNFLNLAKSKRYENPKTEKERKNRVDAMWNAAQILENDQDYAKAAEWFLKYSEAKGPSKEGAEAYFRAGLIYKKMGKVNSMIRIFREFPKRFGSVAKQERRIVEGIFRIAEFYDEERKDWRNAKKYYQQTIDSWRRYGAKPAGDAAEFAANAAFQLAEKKLEGYLKTKISGSLKSIPRKETEMAKSAGTLKKEYEAIWQFKRARWTLAAMYRSGTIFAHFAKTMDGAYRNAPIPKQVKRLGPEAIDIYMTQVDALLVERVDPLVDQAKTLYSSCIQKAREMGVSNDYTEEALVKLNAFDPNTYPLLKKARVDYSLE